MTPQEAIQKLIDRKWSVAQIASTAGIHRSNVYKALKGEATPHFDKAIELIKLANSGRNPPRKTA